MPVPTYSVIADSEIDPESPITTSLLRRLRDNVCALFGIDPATPSPVIPLAPSIAVEEYTSHTTRAANNATGPEVRLSLLTDAMESFEINDGEHLSQDATPWNDIYKAFISGVSNTGALGYAFAIGSVKVQTTYASAAPSAVRVRANCAVASGYVLAQGVNVDVSVPINNTWTTVWTTAAGTFAAKVRADSSGILIQFRFTGAGGTIDVVISGYSIRRHYVSKA